MANRSQMDALSPWLVAEKVKRREEGGECPDCVAEREMKRRYGARSEMSETTPRVNEKVVAKTSDAAALPVSSAESDLRLGPKIAVEAGKAALSTLSPVARASRPETVRKECGIVPMTVPVDVKISMPAIMPDLISYIDYMATKMRVDIGQEKPAAMGPAVRRRLKSQSLLQSEEVAPLLMPWTAEHEIIERDYWALKREACLDSLTQSPISKEALQSVYATTSDSSDSSRVLPKPPPVAELPSAILRSDDLSPAPGHTLPFTLSAIRTPGARTPISGTPTTYYTAPTSLHPTPPTALRPQKRVRVVDAWPPRELPKRGQVLSPLSSINAREREQFTRQSMRLDTQQAVMDAAEMERAMRRNVRAKGGLAGPSAWKK
ncbi:hypothetical protein LTR95_013165 [Oleoguttula sp. CCFEE 5521]